MAAVNACGLVIEISQYLEGKTGFGYYFSFSPSLFRASGVGSVV